MVYGGWPEGQADASPEPRAAGWLSPLLRGVLLQPKD